MMIYVSVIESPAEQSLFEQIYYAYRDMLYGVAMKHLHNELDAEDAVHQTFLYVAENFYKFSAGVCHKTARYLVITVRCRAMDILRQKNRCLPLEDAEDMPADKQEYPGLSILARCIAKLPENYRDALILRMHYGFTFREIAKLMGISEANARKLVTRAKNMLKKICIEEGVL
jgi:RNA polymerase sigma-70 factor (ECF subfamily)